jgi:hypothetical protein
MNEQELAILRMIHDEPGLVDLPDDLEFEAEEIFERLIDEGFIGLDSEYGLSAELTDKGKIAIGVAVPDSQERLL